MSAPTRSVRDLMLVRDGRRCVSCGAVSPLEAQHRRAVGMGGSRIRPLVAELLTACSLCNARFESVLQTRALAFGWKVRQWVRDPSGVPVLYRPERAWFVLDGDGSRVGVSPAVAVSLMRSVYGPEWDVWRAAA
jgi:hypothetical protein